MFERLTQLRRSSELLIECRHCGTAVTRKTDHCPVCQRGEFARYDLSSA